MKVIEALTSAGLSVALEEDNIRVKPKDPGVKPDPSIVRPLIEELQARKAEVIVHLSSQTVVCSWLETSVFANECVKPCYHFDPGEVKECKHLITWWRQRAKWLQDNNLWVKKREQQ